MSEHFNLGMPFYYQSKKILNRFYDSIKDTKDDVICGLVTSITLLCSQKKEVSVCAICDRLGIKMSTIHRQVERRVIQRFNVPGFKTLVKSAELLKKVMNGSEDHFLFVKEASGYYVSSITNRQDNLNADHNLNLKEFNTSNKNEIGEDQEPVKVELWKFYNPKGPPVLC
ncbi:MAG: hypothetical protein ACTSQL_12340 [Promethearchaeota archaeon]